MVLANPRGQSWISALAAGALALSGAAGCGAGARDAGRPLPSGPAADAADAPPPASFGGADAEPMAPPAAESAPGAAPMAREEGAARPADLHDAPSPRARPGLGTEWGETRHSRITTVPFARASSSSPFAVASLFYNDAAGAQAMARAAGGAVDSVSMVPVAGGALELGLRDERGAFLTAVVDASGKHHVVGEAGRRYSIVVRNRSDQRLEVVLSVDGLDVLDGRPASFGKRGYLVEPSGELEVDGFRQSTESVAAFRFGSVRNSYANKKHGDARNVGVIGIAAFHERGFGPPTGLGEARRRRNANPFPGQFATPP